MSMGWNIRRKKLIPNGTDKNQQIALEDTGEWLIWNMVSKGEESDFHPLYTQTKLGDENIDEEGKFCVTEESQQQT